MRARYLSAIVLSLLVPAGSSEAQESTARLVGTIIEHESGKPISGARVALSGTDVWVVSDARGKFTLDGPRPGAFDMHVERLGFQSRVQSGLQLGDQRVQQ